MKNRLKKMLAAMEARKADLVARSAGSTDVAEVRSINVDLTKVNEEIAEVRAALEELEAEERKAAAPEGNGDPLASTDPNAPQMRNMMGPQGLEAEERKKATEAMDKRGAALKDKKAIVVSFNEAPEERAVTIASGTLVVQKKYSNTLNETFNEVSSLIDMVSAVPLIGGESYTKGFEIAFDEADYTTETGAYTDGEPTVGYVEIGKAKITAYSEITDEAQKLPNIDYAALVLKSIRIAIRKKVTRQLLIGAGGANAITGILNAPVAVIPAATDLEFTAIDADTLDEIVLGYGGDEDVEGMAVLIINKKTLKNFAAVRSTTGEKLYKITVDSNGNTGTISSEGSWSVPYVLNSAVAGFDDVANDAYFGAYGKLMSYEMPVFSPLTVQESVDFKFSTGQVAYRGSIWCGGNVASYKGFVKLKKVAA